MTWQVISSYISLQLLFGFYLSRIKERCAARATGWLLAVITLVVSIVLSNGLSPLNRLMVITFLQLLSMKVMVVIETYSGEPRLNALQWVAFSIGWFGMRPVLFETFPSRSRALVTLLLKGLSRIVVGLLLLFLSNLLIENELLQILFLPQFLTLAGLSLILHFGIINLCTCWWRLCGVDAPELFRSPYRSRSLQEFWSKRWNIAFSEMTSIIAYRPLKLRIGSERAMFASFLLSGLLHEIAISLTVNAGYGLPMLYFTVHAYAKHLETKASLVRKIIAHRILAYVWVMALLILPLPLLFHEEFFNQVLMPLSDFLLEAIHLQ